MLETISGNWEISANGVKERDDAGPYKPHLGLPNEPSLIASGVSTVVENTFKRITGADRSPFSDDDAVAVLDAELCPAVAAGETSLGCLGVNTFRLRIGPVDRWDH